MTAQHAFATVSLPLEHHRNALRVHCYRMVGSYTEADDLVQETMIRAWSAQSAYDPKTGELGLRRWLYRIATNACLDFLKSASRNVQYVADPGSIVIGVALLGVGRAGHWREMADLGLHGTEAVLLSGAVTGGLKAITSRSRHFFGGVSDARYQSFPSGHTTVAFAAAAAVTTESRRWWPRGTWLVAPVMYGGATLVGLSRMYNNAHWASDVALGAGIGTFSGLKVVRYSHTHPDNVIDRAILATRIAPAPSGGILLEWSVTGLP